MDSKNTVVSKVRVRDPWEAAFPRPSHLQIKSVIFDSPAYRLYFARLERTGGTEDLPQEADAVLEVHIDGNKRSPHRVSHLLTPQELGDLVARLNSGENPQKISDELKVCGRIDQQYAAFAEQLQQLAFATYVSQNQISRVPTHVLVKVPFDTPREVVDGDLTKTGFVEPIAFNSIASQNLVADFAGTFLRAPERCEVDFNGKPHTIIELEGMPDRTNVRFKPKRFAEFSGDVDFKEVNLYKSTAGGDYPNALLLEGHGDSLSHAAAALCRGGRTKSYYFVANRFSALPKSN